MSYTKTTWAVQTPISARNLDNMDSQYSAVNEHWHTNSFRVDTGEDLVAEVSASAPTHADGRIYHDSGGNRLKASADGEWHDLDAEDMTGIS